MCGGIKGRIQISASWHDRFGRVTDTAAFGTYGGNTFTRTSMSVPTRSDNDLVTSYDYDNTGALVEVEDPKGLVTAYVHDDAGRQVKVIANFDANVNSGNPSTSGGGTNQTIEYVFTDGLKTKMIARMPSSSDDQETVYAYGTVRGTSAGESKIATGHLLQKATYPDSGGASDVTTFAYNGQGQPIWTKDQAGNVIETDYDDAERQTARKVTTLVTGFDDV